MKIVFRPQVVDDISEMFYYIEKDLKNPAAANRLKEKLLSGISLLKEDPLLGMCVSEKYPKITTELRFLVTGNFFVFYIPTAEAVEIVRVLDGRTDYMSRLF